MNFGFKSVCDPVRSGAVLGCWSTVFAVLLAALGCSNDASGRDGKDPRPGTPLRVVDRAALEEIDPNDVRQLVECVQTYDGVVASHGGKIEISLNFSATDLNDDDLATLEFPDSVRTINLSRTKITDQGLLHLERARNLNRVILNETAITEAGLETLKAMESISIVELSQCPNISREARLDLIRYLAPRSRSHQHERRMQALNRDD